MDGLLVTTAGLEVFSGFLTEQAKFNVCVVYVEWVFSEYTRSIYPQNIHAEYTDHSKLSDSRLSNESRQLL
ncbi:MAG: hypothetical protein ACFBSC_04005, partial [Microcoleaceae cyanobacterium]